jgi:hypothetical protein
MSIIVTSSEIGAGYLLNIKQKRYKFSPAVQHAVSCISQLISVYRNVQLLCGTWHCVFLVLLFTFSLTRINLYNQHKPRGKRAQSVITIRNLCER